MDSIKARKLHFVLISFITIFLIVFFTISQYKKFTIVYVFLGKEISIPFYEIIPWLFFIPIILSGIILGKGYCLPITTVLGMIYLVYIWKEWPIGGMPTTLKGIQMSMLDISFLFVGFITSYLADKVKEEKERFTHLQDLFLKFKEKPSIEFIRDITLQEILKAIFVEEGYFLLKPFDFEENNIEDYVVQNKKVFLSNNCKEDVRLNFNKKIQLNSILCCPVIIDNEIFGVITLYNKIHNIFTEDDIETINSVLEYTKQVIENYNLIQDLIKEEKEKLKIKNIFSTYVTSQVAEEILKDPDKLKLGGKKCEVTILFADIRGFTAISEKLSPEEVVSHLNEYFSAMIDIIFKYEGTLDKFIGDCIMCYWGAPIEVDDNAERAIKCAMEMQNKLIELNKKWQGEGRVLFDIGIGINTGEAVAGNIGDIRKMEYTVIGDNVNLAQRLEGLNKEFKTKILISENTYDKVKDLVEIKKLSEVEVKGKSEKIVIYEVVGILKPIFNF